MSSIPIILKSIFVVTGFSMTSIACKPKAKVRAGVTVVKVIPNKGCVASWWGGRFSEEKVQTLAGKHIGGETKPSQIDTELMVAVVRGQRNMVSSLLEENVNFDESNEHGCTALIWAAALEREGIVFDLLEAGADVSRSDGNGKTPLMVAAKSGNSKIVQYLISAGADVNAAQTGGNNEVGKTPLHNAVIHKNNVGVIRMLIDNGANLNATDENGKTALMGAAFFGGLDAVKLLVESGADTQLKSNSGKTALDTAIMRNRTEMIEYIKSL